ncbi:MAG: T9SS type A sorting domain-containing protein, partial [Saprospiraceae bacterium]
RFMYQEVDGTVTHNRVPDTDDRSNWKLVPLPVATAPDEDTNTDLTCPVSGEFQNDNTRDVDIPDAVNVGTADDRSCYSDYSESMVYGKTWGVYNITDGSNHWDGATLQPRIERSLPRSGESGVGSYARFTGIVRILEVGDAGSFSQDGSYLIQAKGKHTGGGGSPDPAICLYLAKPVYGTGANADKQVAFDIYAERILVRGGEGSGREVIFLKRVNKDEEVDFELEIGFRADPNDAEQKVHYCDAVIGGDAFNYNIPDPDRGLESGIRYGAYRVKGGRAQFRWADTTYEMEEVVDENGGTDPIEGIYNFRNVETGQYLTAAGAGNEAITMSATGDAVNTHWRFVASGAFQNIDSESATGGTGVLRARGDNLIVSTTKAPPTTDGDKVWTIEYDENTDTYRFRAGTSSRYMYHNAEGAANEVTVVSNAPANDNRSVWEAVAVIALPLDFISFTAKNVKTGTQLNWEIANEKNNSYFEILRGNDLNEFQSIGRIKNEPGQKHYQFLDSQMANQISYYKIKQVDTDGKFSFSNIISVKSNVESFTLYPNPVGQHEVLTIESQEGYQIFNSQGMLVRSGTEKTIKMDLEKGVYFLKQNDSSEVKRFIVN